MKILMHLIKNLAILIVFLALLAGILYFVLGEVTGLLLEPKLEKKLTELFGIPVRIEKLYAHPIKGKVHAERITFDNLPIFDDRPHLDAKGIEFEIDFLALRDKKVIIKHVILRNAFYLLSRFQAEDGVKNNIKTWHRHMKSRRKKSKGSGPSKWKVDIGRIELYNTTFIYDSRVESGKKLVFTNIYGYLDHFKWPSPNPELMKQDVRLSGKMGEKYPANFWIEGRSDFATSRVSFDLKGMLTGGNLLDYRSLWQGMPVEFTQGTFDVKANARCLYRDMVSENQLTISNIRAKAGESAGDKIWSVPVKAWLRFVQTQEEIVLNIPVEGRVSDPEFLLDEAFDKAFRNALKNKTQSGFKVFQNAGSKLASGTKSIFTGTSSQVAEGMGKVRSSVKPGAKDGDE